ncbi:MAG: bifunctional transaldolase/phosoglucose isomerase [Acidobacteria bacterium]|nr:bifunctional transaldolase/phosoglucose isomerase [Acidobacteriota bacterium]
MLMPIRPAPEVGHGRCRRLPYPARSVLPILQDLCYSFLCCAPGNGSTMSENSAQLTYSLPDAFAAAVRASLDDWRRDKKVSRLWGRDALLWTGSDEANWLGWLDLTKTTAEQCRELAAFADEIRHEGFTHALVLGMGGSSMCPEVLAGTFGRQPGYPALHVLDSTDPAQVKSCEERMDLAKTLFIVASKSGSTLEPNIFKQYFFERAKQAAGSATAGKHFVAITDPGSKMQRVAERDGFRKIFFGVPSVGGRYSALSNFGLVPAAVMGLDWKQLLTRAREMVCACSAEIEVERNPGLVLGTLLGVAARSGRDKVTLVSSPQVFGLGAWLEQLLAESTGKEGKALIPVDREQLAEPALYGDDRIFVYLRLASAPDPVQDGAVAALEQAGHPVVCVSLRDPYDLAAEFFRWEIATAVAGSVLAVHPFNQPDVEASKVETRNLTEAYEQAGAFPEETPLLSEGGVQLFTDAANASALAGLAGSDRSLAGYLRAHLNRIVPRDYFALLAYVEMNAAHEQRLQQIRHAVRDARRVATCLGFGPRFLHSTGQAYKGGPNTGVFLQITCNDAVDLPVPGAKYSFGVVKAAQARGDFEVLVERRRRALRVHLGTDVGAGLAVLLAAIRRVLA